MAVEVNGNTFGVQGDYAEQIYRDVFEEHGIEIVSGPHWKEAANPGEDDTVVVGIATNDLDTALEWAMPRAMEQLRALHDYNSITEAQPARTEERTTVVVNMFGGPGAGKTTGALEVAEKLKKAGYIVEYAPEYAKELVWDLGGNDQEAREKARDLLSGRYDMQTQVYTEQLKRVRRCIGQCDFVVTDSPALLSLAYLKEATPSQREQFTARAFADFAAMNNFNMFVERGKEYEQAGRVQNKREAADIDWYVRDMLEENDLYFGTYSHEQIDKAIENMQKTLRRFQRAEDTRRATPPDLEKNDMPELDADALGEERDATEYDRHALCNQLPGDLQTGLRSKLEGTLEASFYMMEPGPRADFITKVIEEAMASPIDELAAEIVDIDPIMNEWAIRESFDVERVVVDEVAKVRIEQDGTQWAYGCHLADDDASPNGYGWYLETFRYDEKSRRWLEGDGAMYWNYDSAEEAIAEIVVAEQGDEVIRVEPRQLDDVGVYNPADLPGRQLTEAELDNSRNIDWVERDLPTFPGYESFETHEYEVPLSGDNVIVAKSGKYDIRLTESEVVCEGKMFYSGSVVDTETGEIAYTVESDAAGPLEQDQARRAVYDGMARQTAHLFAQSSAITEEPFPAPSCFEVRPRENGLPGEVYACSRSGEGHTYEVEIIHDAAVGDYEMRVFVDDGKLGRPTETACYTSLHESFESAYAKAYERVCGEIGDIGIATPSGERGSLEGLLKAGLMTPPAARTTDYPRTTMRSDAYITNLSTPKISCAR